MQLAVGKEKFKEFNKRGGSLQLLQLLAWLTMSRYHVVSYPCFAASVEV